MVFWFAYVDIICILKIRSGMLFIASINGVEMGKRQKKGQFYLWERRGGIDLITLCYKEYQT